MVPERSEILGRGLSPAISRLEASDTKVYGDYMDMTVTFGSFRRFRRIRSHREVLAS